MARAQGARALLALACETVYGTPPTRGFTKMPFASTTLGAEQPLLNSELLGYGRDPLAPIKDAATADGDRTKNGKPHITHLAQPAFDELARLKTLTGNKPFVFTTTGTTPMSGSNRFKSRLDRRLGESVAAWRLHDLRTGFATAMAEAGEPENVVDRILNHVASGSAPSAVARVYNRAELLPQQAQVRERWAELVTRQAGLDLL